MPAISSQIVYVVCQGTHFFAFGHLASTCQEQNLLQIAPWEASLTHRDYNNEYATGSHYCSY